MALDEVMKGRTTFVIAKHLRLATMPTRCHAYSCFAMEVLWRQGASTSLRRRGGFFAELAEGRVRPRCAGGGVVYIWWSALHEAQIAFDFCLTCLACASMKFSRQPPSTLPSASCSEED